MAGPLTLIPNEAIRGGDKGTFEFILGNQIERINSLRSKTLMTSPLQWKNGMISIYWALQDMETLLWGKLQFNKDYQAEKEKLQLSFDPLTKNDLASMLEFSSDLDKWYKLLTIGLRDFDFYPTAKIDFVSGRGELP